MKLSFIYRQAVRFGRERDPRQKKNFTAFEDSRILFGDPDSEVKRVLLGIDIDTAELLLADRLRQQERLDLVIAHHPSGGAYANLAEVMRLQADLLRKAGLDKEVAKELLEQRQEEVRRRVISANHTRAVDSARILNMPFMCLHTPADNHAYYYLNALLRRKKPRSLRAVLEVLKAIPEYRLAEEISAGPRIILGSPQRKTGRIILEMTGGTEGPKEAADKLYKAGVRTIISMHASEEYFKKAKEANLNLIIAGHICSDVLGLNLLLDRIEQAAGERLEVIGCSGFRRISRY